LLSLTTRLPTRPVQANRFWASNGNAATYQERITLQASAASTAAKRQKLLAAAGSTPIPGAAASSVQPPPQQPPQQPPPQQQQPSQQQPQQLVLQQAPASKAGQKQRGKGCLVPACEWGRHGQAYPLGIGRCFCGGGGKAVPDQDIKGAPAWQRPPGSALRADLCMHVRPWFCACCIHLTRARPPISPRPDWFAGKNKTHAESKNMPDNVTRGTYAMKQQWIAQRKAEYLAQIEPAKRMAGIKQARFWVVETSKGPAQG
jgi:hypothetical protein